MKPQALNSQTFNDAIAATDKPVLVDFWAEWCGPCRMLAPILDQIASEQGDRATIAKVDIDAHPELADRFGVRAIPTLIVFKNGQPVNVITGVRSKSFIESALAA